jgi:hypothetical protein
MIGDTLSQGHAAELLQHYRGSVPPA